MRESFQAQQFKKTLPKELQDSAKVSFSYQQFWNIISNNLQELYGKFANPEYCLLSYFDCEEYKTNCQIVNCCDDIPLIDIDNINDMLIEEENYFKNVQKVLNLFNFNNDNTIEIANILGVLPNKNDEALFRYIFAKNRLCEKELYKINKSLIGNRNLLEVIVDMLVQSFNNGYLLEFPATGSVMTQQHGRYYYRGENAFYRVSKASFYRTIDNSPPIQIRKIIDRMRLYQCWETLDQFDAIKYWNYSEINYMALSQHYGFKTSMLDITSDLKTALFFACCKYGSDNHWHPLKNDDFVHIDSRHYISDNGGDSRYGLLYRSPSEITDLRWCIEGESAAFEIITPVGYQPFMRCSHQHAYMMLTQANYDLLKDKYFDKYKFRLTEELCDWIYNEMEQGSLIYPYDDIPDISNEIEKINKQKTFSSSVFEITANDFKIDSKYFNCLINTLEEYGIKIKNNVSIFNPIKLSKINRDYTADYAMKKIEELPKMRPLLTLPSDTLVYDC
ncbi:MAG: FRG domain-containing protein [Acetobacter sp.]|nr:FRG domain-containing protein [Bacteroides sp.]MCM1340119.1 FRG domain-containing protein [Acetobacter sp.]MCM1432701.1 FRG domain-containing protein [Clostridiales bacterium]